MMLGTKGKMIIVYQMVKNIGEWCSAVVWKAELVSKELGYLGE